MIRTKLMQLLFPCMISDSQASICFCCETKNLKHDFYLLLYQPWPYIWNPWGPTSILSFHKGTTVITLLQLL